MRTCFELALVAGGDAPRLRLSLSPLPERLEALRLRSRDGSRVIEAALRIDEDAAVAELPVPALLADAPLRWDVQLRTTGSSSFTHATGDASVGGARHFFSTTIGGHGLSAYLSESASSLALFSAPAGQHARQVELEDARAGFAEALRILPLEENLVLFESFLGKAYAGNPRYVYEALRIARPDLRCVWVYNGNQAIPGDPQRVTRGSAEYYRLLAQAHYRVNNVIFAAQGRKPETVYLQTWHGTPLKRLGYDIEVSGPEADARENFHRESRAWTHLISANAYSSETFRRAFRYDGEVLEVGYPLADPLLTPVQDRNVLALSLGLPTDRRFVLYAPTWRDHRPVGTWRFDFDLNLDLEAMSAALAEDQVLLIKAHHLVSAGLDQLVLPANILNVSHLDDVTDLCVLADVLITDYSSVFFDYANTGRPILFYCYDLELYAGQIRGFYLDVADDLPGPIARSSAELMTLLRDLPAVQAAYAERYTRFRSRFCALNNGQVALNVVDIVFGAAPQANHQATDLLTQPLATLVSSGDRACA